MKKSQILAALALAFALGVVAPVAGVVSNASAYSEEKGTATYSDTTSAINYVENNAAYKAYVKIQNAIQTYVENTSDYADFVNADNDTIADVAGALSAAYIAANGVESAFGYNTAKIGNEITNASSFAEQTKIAIAAAKTSTLYNDLATIIDLVENASDNATNNKKLQDAVQKLRVDAGPDGLNVIVGTDYDNLHPEKATINGYKGSNAVRNILPGTYAKATDIFNALDNAEEALAKYEAGYKLFMPLLTDSGLLDQAGKDLIRTEKNIKVGQLCYLADHNINHDAEWANLYNEVQSVKNKRYQDESGDNYQLIRNLALKWQAASGNEEKTTTVMARMVAYKAPANTNDDETTIKDPNLKPGNTGALNSTAEGTASTTVSIVAGLATALTALGAGVVAYRNARRSSEN